MKNLDTKTLTLIYFQSRSLSSPLEDHESGYRKPPGKEHLFARGSVVSVCFLLVVQNRNIVLKPNDKHTNLNQASNVRLPSGNCETIKQPNKRQRMKAFDTLTSPFSLARNSFFLSLVGTTIALPAARS